MTKATLTVLAGDSGKIKDVNLAALCDPATAKGRVGLGHDDGSAGGESEDGGGELHGDCCLGCLLGCLLGVFL
jgi:hypothetical protein